MSRSKSYTIILLLIIIGCCIANVSEAKKKVTKSAHVSTSTPATDSVSTSVPVPDSVSVPAIVPDSTTAVDSVSTATSTPTPVSTPTTEIKPNAVRDSIMGWEVWVTDASILTKYPQATVVAKNGAGDVRVFLDPEKSQDMDLAKELNLSLDSTKMVVRQPQKKFEGIIFTVAEEMPTFPGGDVALQQFINETVQFPEDVIKNGIQGKVYVRFLIDSKGKVRTPKIARGVYPSLDEEALRIVKKMPNWNPGKQEGEAVIVSYTMPINFTMKLAQ